MESISVLELKKCNVHMAISRRGPGIFSVFLIGFGATIRVFCWLVECFSELIGKLFYGSH